MKAENRFVTYITEDVLGHIPQISARAMFGGYGIYQDGLIFAIIAEDQLYFKVDDSNRAEYEALGSHPFVYSQGNHKKATMSYWLVPESVLEDKEAIRLWVEKSVRITKQKQARKPKK